MSKQKYNIEHKNYAMKVMEWFYSIETDFDPDKHEVGESNYSIIVNTAPFKSMIVDLTRVNGKVAVILQYPSSSVAQAMHTKPTIKVYYPKHVEKSFHDYDETGKYMYAAKVDDTFWFFEERISGMPASFGGINTSFGMDMTMPFLEQQNWEEYDMSVWFDNKSMPLDTFKAKCLGQILLTGPYKVYIKRTGTQVDKLNTCNMSVTSYTITYK